MRVVGQYSNSVNQLKELPAAPQSPRRPILAKHVSLGPVKSDLAASVAGPSV